MVQNSLSKNIISIIFRISLFVGILFFAMFVLYPIHDFILGTLNYKNPSDFFGTSWAEWSLAWVLTCVLWGGIIFGTLGKKIDYIFFALILSLALWEFVFTDNVTLQMYLGLVGIAVLGNILGYMLKVGRQNYFGK